jgi:hypothetical protein
MVDACSWPAASRQGCSLLGPEVDDALAGPEATELLQEVSVVTGFKDQPVWLSICACVSISVRCCPFHQLFVCLQLLYRTRRCCSLAEQLAVFYMYWIVKYQLKPVFFRLLCVVASMACVSIC